MVKNNKNISESESSSDSSSGEEIVVKKKIVKKDLASDKKKGGKKVASSDSSGDSKVGLTKKDLKNLDKQKKVFKKIKKLLGMADYDIIFIFTSFRLEKIRNDLMEDLLPEIKNIFNCKVWREIESDNKFCDISLLRKMFKYYGYKINTAHVENKMGSYKTYTVIKN